MSIALAQGCLLLAILLWTWGASWQLSILPFLAFLLDFYVDLVRLALAPLELDSYR